MAQGSWWQNEAAVQGAERNHGSGPKLKSVAPQRCAGHLALSPFSGPSWWGWWLPPEGRGRGEKEEQAAQQHAPGALLPPYHVGPAFCCHPGPRGMASCITRGLKEPVLQPFRWKHPFPFVEKLVLTSRAWVPRWTEEQVAPPPSLRFPNQLPFP